MIVFFNVVFLVKLSDRAFGLRLAALFLWEHLLFLRASSMADKSPWDADVSQQIICVLQLKFEKAPLSF